ncbi:MAG: selenocysteine-specific translation elongation factor [Firmicutes bacterium]|nr:selenocysteine-specific translation elongation factor [Bacillota bacterium]
MRHVIIGTAGHVDHGKTTLVKALTGVNTDRLKAEQERGLTIELGFAPLTLPSGVRAGVVDVPGHERFVGNMLAGATGIDVALLVVAADEGVMPQTREHLDILNLLGTEVGVVALTKADIVDEDWLELAMEDVREQLASTRLSGAPIVPVSAVTGQGLDRLVEELDAAVARAAQMSEGQEEWNCARLPIDRVFTIAGHGTVVTGTLVGGSVRPGDRLELLPVGKPVRVRGVQVHGVTVPEAFRGQRVALNLAGVEKTEADRGMLLAAPGMLEPANLIDVELHVLPTAEPVGHGDRMHLHIGTSEVTCRVRVIGADAALPGEVSYAQLEVDGGAVVAARGDHFVVRTYSPMVTAGGGRVLATAAARSKRFREESVREYTVLASGDDAALVTLAADRIVRTRLRGATAAEVAKALFWPESRAAAALDAQAKVGAVVVLGEKGDPGAGADGERSYIPRHRWEQLVASLRGALEAFHAAQPLRRGMPREELRTQALPDWDSRAFAAVVAKAIADGVLEDAGTVVCLPGRQVQLSEDDARWARSIDEMFVADLMSPPDRAAVLATGAPAAVLDYLIDQGVLVRIGPELLFHRDALARAEAVVRELGAEGRPFSAAAFRDACGNSRKFAVALLEHFDSVRLTRRVGDERVLGR